jgi:putative exporter of polyketide antibiotics
MIAVSVTASSCVGVISSFLQEDKTSKKAVAKANALNRLLNNNFMVLLFKFF